MTGKQEMAFDVTIAILHTSITGTVSTSDVIVVDWVLWNIKRLSVSVPYSFYFAFNCKEKTEREETVKERTDREWTYRIVAVSV